MAGSTGAVYTHSGKLGLGPIVVPIGAFISAVALGIAYAYVVVYVPLVGYLSLIFVACFAGGLGLSVAYLGFLARCRSVGFLRLAGVACPVPSALNWEDVRTELA